ncbi:MAG: glycosyltransferase family 4 protein [Gammaproteobacteria bacterium]|nr:glycosyltransferase family 4 protein [Gammaproteobacteria bacterium]
MAKKVLLIQPGYAHYRDELFSILSKRYDLFILYEKKKKVYPGAERPKGDNHRFIIQTPLFKWLNYILSLVRSNPDIVVTSTSTSLRTLVAYLYSRLFGKKFILWILEWQEPVYDINTFAGNIKRLRKAIANKIILKSDALLVGGSASYNYALSLGKKSDEIFTATQCAKDLYANGQKRRVKANDVVFIYLSRIIKWKGLDFLIRAFSKLENESDNVKLIIAGDGPFRKECVELCENLQSENVTFLGSVDSSDVNDIYSSADIFVLPSITYRNSYEAWGLVVNEAMSMKMPVITTDAVGAAYDLVKDNGIVVKNANVDELYQAMKKILSMNLNLLGEASRKIFVSKNDYYKMADGFTSAIEYVSGK